MTAISVTDLHKSYDGTEAVRDVSFDVAAGEVFCLLGPNGAGKTTTVEILEGYRLADSGTVRVLGADPARGERALRDRIGIVLQAGGLQPELTVGEVLEMYARWYPSAAARDELIELVELDDKRDARVRDALGRPAPAPRPRARPGRRPRAAVPRRAHHRLRPRARRPRVVDDPLALLAGQDRLPHHPLHGRGAGAGRPRRGDGARAGSSPSGRPSSSAGRDAAADRDPLPRCPTASVAACPTSRGVARRDGHGVLVRTPDAGRRHAPPHRLGARSAASRWTASPSPSRRSKTSTCAHAEPRMTLAPSPSLRLTRRLAGPLRAALVLAQPARGALLVPVPRACCSSSSRRSTSTHTPSTRRGGVSDAPVPARDHRLRRS